MAHFIAKIQQFELLSLYGAWHQNRNAVSLKKVSSLDFQQYNHFKYLQKICLCERMLVLEWQERAFIEKVDSRCFCRFLAAILVDQNGTPIWHLHTKLHKGVWGVLANNSETVCQRDLRLGQIVYILVFYSISFSWLLLFCFVTVKMIYTELICSKAYSPNMGRVDSDACTCIK